MSETERPKRRIRYRTSDLLLLAALFAGHIEILCLVYPNEIVGVPRAGRIGGYAILSFLVSFGALYLSARATTTYRIESLLTRTAITLVLDFVVIILLLSLYWLNGLLGGLVEMALSFIIAIAFLYEWLIRRREARKQ